MPTEGDTIQFSYAGERVVGRLLAICPSAEMWGGTARYDVTVKIGRTVRRYASVNDEDIEVKQRHDA